jgi:hypothetical protein
MPPFLHESEFGFRTRTSWKRIRISVPVLDYLEKNAEKENSRSTVRNITFTNMRKAKVP